MAVTPAMIKELRESTNAGLMDCKKALAASEGDMQGAVEWLREKGLSKAAKVAGKIAAEGVVSVVVADDCAKATIIEVNSETDFVAKNENFTGFVDVMANAIYSSSFKTIDEVKAGELEGKPYETHIAEATAKVGEKIDVRRFTTFEAPESGLVNGYTHSNGQMGAIVCVETDSKATADAVKDLVKDIAMHATAMNPEYLNESEIPQEILDRETEFAKNQLKEEGKPEAIWDKILPGKIKKYAKDNCLVDQAFVKDDKQSVSGALSAAAKAAGGEAKIVAFSRFQVGEGIEKKEDNFADEVAAQLKK
ncbi:MAG: translation elongation factor Ts [Campylobacterales bacterium]|nr:translation elongation factor Ts [Campylobacterales bacterium]